MVMFEDITYKLADCNIILGKGFKDIIEFFLIQHVEQGGAELKSGLVTRL